MTPGTPKLGLQKRPTRTYKGKVESERIASSQIY